MKNPDVLARITAATTVLLLAACENSVGPEQQNSDWEVGIHATRLQIAPGEDLQMGLVATDLKRQLTYEFPDAPFNPYPADQPVRWGVTNSAVATITQTGLVRAVAAGQTNVWVETFGKGDTVRLQVVSPPPVSIRSYTAMDAGQFHACAIGEDQRSYCWGVDSYGQLGRDRWERFTVAASPEPVAQEYTWRSVSAGAQHTCALDPGGRAYCWGSNVGGQLGNGTRYEGVPKFPEGIQHRPTLVQTDVAFAAISAGADHTCAIDADGLAYCWGVNTFGQLGNGSTDLAVTPTPVRGQRRYRSIVAGTSHTCGVSVEGDAFCWGLNNFGQLGSMSAEDTSCRENPCSKVPVPVESNAAFQSVTLGVDHTCAVATDGSPYCWGGNGNGQLGQPDPASLPRPARVPDVPALRGITAGSFHTCGVTTSAAVYCWGDNGYGQLGRGSATGYFNNTPKPVLGTANFAEVELTRFGGHLQIQRKGGIHDAENETAVPAGVSGADRRAGAAGPHARGAVPGVRADGHHHLQLGQAE